jgi:ribosomal protein S18 acetylase RimI-like enzyme
MNALTIRPLHTGDYQNWLPLWNGNNDGHYDAIVTDETWRRLNDPDFPVFGLCAELDGAMAGLVHYVLHPTTGNLKLICYMQDVYVSPEFRQRGIARALVTDLAARALKQGWARVYWLADTQNTAAQNLYKNLGVKLDFTLHVLPIG